MKQEDRDWILNYIAAGVALGIVASCLLAAAYFSAASDSAQGHWMNPCEAGLMNWTDYPNPSAFPACMRIDVYVRINESCQDSIGFCETKRVDGMYCPESSHDKLCPSDLKILVKP